MKSHLEKDNPRTMSHPEEDGADPTQDGANPTQDQDGANPTNLTFQIEEAMEEEESSVAQASQVEEGDAGCTALPLKST